ncbi:hypothetical protein [Phytobacter sp. SCO41]|uniref:hypothetical protein n=1 Tax=Phytobacter sp. SCO41 TaxID=1756993 RepID=UPI000D50087E|nr:hypothetical protein [Phytobacter sp. SCO41]
MKGVRKFLSEFSVIITSKGWLMFTPEQLHSQGVMRQEHREIADNSHIYMVCKSLKAFCAPENPCLDDGMVSGYIISKEKGKEVKYSYKFPFEFIEDEVRLVVSDYPHNQIQTLNENDDVIRFWPSTQLALFTMEKVFYSYDVLYVGQAYADGKRTAIDRLKSHSTLQKILADSTYHHPDDQIIIFIFEYDDYYLGAIFNGLDKGSIRGDEDEARFLSVRENILSVKQIICLAEAGLIRYFQPKYNEVYKNSFPAADQKILDECLELDFSGVSVEVDTSALGINLFSSLVTPKEHHLAMFNLTDEAVRLGFFTMSDGVNEPFTMHGVFPLTK